MIRSLQGVITDYGPHHAVVVVNNIGYYVAMNTLRSALVVGDEVYLHTYLAVRETALDLYGFTTARELELFELLLTIPKIGPKSALHVLAQADPHLILEAIHKKDGTYLHKVSGIGKKTAEAIVQHLQDKLTDFDSEFSPTAPTPSTHSDVIEALIALGYSATEARESVRASAPNTDSKDLIKEALRQLHTK